MQRERVKRIAILLVRLFSSTGISLAQSLKRFSATFSNEQLANVLKTISEKSGVYVGFAYEDVGRIKGAKSLKNVTASEAVTAVLENTQLGFSVSNNSITVF